MGCSGLSVLGRISFWKVEVFTEGGETRRELALERPHEPIDDALWDAGPLFHNVHTQHFSLPMFHFLSKKRQNCTTSSSKNIKNDNITGFRLYRDDGTNALFILEHVSTFCVCFSSISV